MALKYGPGTIDFVRSLAPGPKKAMRAALDILAADARGAPGLDVKQLAGDAGTPPVYRVRVGDYRIVYAFHGRHAYVLRIFHRRDGYAWLERV